MTCDNTILTLCISSQDVGPNDTPSMRHEIAPKKLPHQGAHETELSSFRTQIYHSQRSMYLYTSYMSDIQYLIYIYFFNIYN